MLQNINQPTSPTSPPQLSFVSNHPAEFPDVYRGITKQTFKQAGIRLVPDWKHPKASPNVPCMPYFIVPLSDNAYEAILYETSDTPQSQKKYRKMVVGHKNIFLESVLYTADKPIAIVEGVLDALSVMQVGGVAVALCGISMSNKLLEELMHHKPVQPLYLMLDNDTAGQNTTKKLAASLQNAHIPFVTAPLDPAYKDPNEALVANPDAFACIAHAEELAKTAATKIPSTPDAVSENELKPTSIATTEETSSPPSAALANEPQSPPVDVSNPIPTDLQNFNSIFAICSNWRVQRNTHNKELPIPTAFCQLDNLLHGGILKERLYVLGAMPGIGKTTFCIQLADQLFRSGKEILFFSLEMSQKQIFERLLVQKAGQIELQLQKSCATTLRLAEKISCGCSDNEFTDDEKELYEATLQAFQAYEHGFDIISGIFQINDIRERVEKHICQTGRHPVVFIDYLQLITSSNSLLSERTAVDGVVKDILRLKQDLHVPVICISSLNRTAYDQPVRMDSFKESGSIEFSADVLFGMQPFYFQHLALLQDCKRKEFEATQKQAFEKNLMNNIPSQIDLVLLKNRTGKTGTIHLLFSHAIGLFSEPSSKDASATSLR